MKKIRTAERLEFHRMVWGGPDPEIVQLKYNIASLREALGDIAIVQAQLVHAGQLLQNRVSLRAPAGSRALADGVFDSSVGCGAGLEQTVRRERGLGLVVVASAHIGLRQIGVAQTNVGEQNRNISIIGLHTFLSGYGFRLSRQPWALSGIRTIPQSSVAVGLQFAPVPACHQAA